MRADRPVRQQPRAPGPLAAAGARAARQGPGRLRRRGLRPHAGRTQAGYGDRDDDGPPSRRLHLPRHGGRLRRGDRKAHDHRCRPLPAHPRHPAAHRPHLPGDVQLPLLAAAVAGEGPVDAGGDRRRALGRLPLDAGYQPRRRLLPPLAPPQGELRRADGAQGHAPLRPGQLVARHRPRARVRHRQPPLLPARHGGPLRADPARGALPRLPRSRALPLRAEAGGQPQPARAVPGCRVARRLPARPLPVQSGHRHRGLHAGGRRLCRRGHDELFAQRLLCLGRLPGLLQRHARPPPTSRRS